MTRGLLARSAQDLRDMDDEQLDEVFFYHDCAYVSMCMVFTYRLFSLPMELTGMDLHQWMWMTRSLYLQLLAHFQQLKWQSYNHFMTL